MRQRWASALATSCLMHACLVGAGAWLLAKAFGHETQNIDVVSDAREDERGIELPRVESLSLGRELSDVASPRGKPEKPPEPEGGSRAARPDLLRAGRGGSPRTDVRALNLSDRVSPLALSRDTTTLAAQSQIQRLRTDRDRRSLDDRRATPNPMELSFVATGPGHLLERRPASRFDPALGSAHGSEPSHSGSNAGVEPGMLEARGQLPGGEVGATEQEALGANTGSGMPSLSARIIMARPPVQRARAAVPANTRGRPADTADSSHAVADVVRSLVHAGGIGGPHGAGAGGEPSAGSEGRDGLDGSGAEAAPSGVDNGRGISMAQDMGYSRYTSQLLQQIDWSHAFPSWAIARGRGGLTVVALTLDGDGRVRALSVVRSSGIDEFDQNLLTAIQRGGPYGPLPAALGRSLSVRIAFDATNPAVGREGPGPGGRQR